MLLRTLRWVGIAALGVCASGATSGCAADANGVASEEDDYRTGGKIQLLVTVDWEGRDLRDDNIAAMKALHAKFPQVKIVHFLNAAYFTKSDADSESTRARTASRSRA